MASETITILDTDQAIEELSYTDRAGLRAAGTRLVGGLRDGVLMTQLSNGVLELDVVPTRGMGIAEVRCGDLRLGWDSPVRGPVHPKFVPLAEPSGLGWLDGFDEWLVRCGLYSNGAPEFDENHQLLHPLHGRIANQPAHHVQVAIDTEQTELALTGTVDETRFHFQKLRLTSSILLGANEASFRVRDRITNLSGSPATAQLLYHLNFGPPILGPGAQLIAPVKRVVPRNEHSAQAIGHWSDYSEPQAGFSEEVFFLSLAADASGQTMVLLKSADGQSGVGIRFNVQQLPCFTLWKNTTSLADGYVTGLEPATNFPNPRSFEEGHGRVVSLPPNEYVDIELEFSVARTASEVGDISAKIEALQNDHEIQLEASPVADWCSS